jgi:uncharacterized protein YfaT (DUF1175 family)
MKKKILLWFLTVIGVSLPFALGIQNYINNSSVIIENKHFTLDKIQNLTIKTKIKGSLRYVRTSPKYDYTYKDNTLTLLNVGPSKKTIFITWYFGIWKFKKTIQSIIKIDPKVEDKNLNGFPDVVELKGKDEKNFRNWFTNIANSLYYNDTKFWKEDQRDCAGFVRFCYKEALKIHDKYWIQKMNYKGKIFDDVQKYNYPNVPYLGVNIFRIKSGLSLDKDNFSFYASGRYLKEFNLQFETKNIDQAIPGDVLVYFHPEDSSFPFHLMIYLGNLGMRNDYGWVIYHTGPINSSGGELRRVKITELMKADPSWLPLPSNPRFLGLFKFKVLDN